MQDIALNQNETVQKNLTFKGKNMKKILIIGIGVGLFYMNLLYGEDKHVGVINSSQKSEKVEKDQKNRVKNNFKVIEHLLSKIEKSIAEIESLRRNIQKFIANKEIEYICASVSSFEDDIKSLKDRILAVTDTDGKKKLNEKIEVYQSLLDREKSNLNNYQCLP
jgi:septal ring factor EnvC (AmiA/AmiB activator)